jgi:single-stranded-DNA-specific exonuclease
VGILGLVAGKIADEFGKPTIVLQDQGAELVGSLRSIPEVNIIEVLEKCSQHLLRFGGHSQAAGLKMKKEKADEFFAQAEKIVSELTPEEAFVSALDIDAEITPQDINWEFMDTLKKMEPFGEGNPEPVFIMKNMKIFELKICGNGSKHLKLSLGSASGSPRFDKMSHRVEAGSPKIFDSIGFGLCEKFPKLAVGDIIDVVFNLSEDSWNGSKKMQIKIIDLQVHER